MSGPVICFTSPGANLNPCPDEDSRMWNGSRQVTSFFARSSRQAAVGRSSREVSRNMTGTTKPCMKSGPRRVRVHYMGLQKMPYENSSR